MIATSDFRRGSTKILWNKEPWIVIDFQHVKPGKGGAFVRTKMRNLITGRTLEETFRSGEKFPEPDLEYKKVQYLYSDGTLYHFMDQDTFEQLSFDMAALGAVLDYLKEQEIYRLINFEGRPISVEAPNFMNLKVAETIPGVRGDTAQGGARKPATMESGLVVQVPLFVYEGETIKVDTRTGEYIERVKEPS